MDIWKKIEAAVGSQTELARLLNITPMAISQWKKRGQIPAGRVIAVERATRGQVSRYEIRPDLYPVERVQSREAAA